MSVKKTILPSLRNQEKGTVKSETETVNDLLTNIPINITELNDLIDARIKLVSEKNWCSPKYLRLKVKGRVVTQIRTTYKKDYDNKQKY